MIFWLFQVPNIASMEIKFVSRYLCTRICDLDQIWKGFSGRSNQICNHQYGEIWTKLVTLIQCTIHNQAKGTGIRVGDCLRRQNKNCKNHKKA